MCVCVRVCVRIVVGGGRLAADRLVGLLPVSPAFGMQLYISHDRSPADPNRVKCIAGS